MIILAIWNNWNNQPGILARRHDAWYAQSLVRFAGRDDMYNFEREFINELNSTGIKHDVINNLFRVTDANKLSPNQIARFAKLNNEKLVKWSGELK